MRIMLDHTLLHRGNLLLVNAQHPLKDRTIDDLTVLTSYFPGIRMRREAAFSLRRILTRLLARNVILPVSGYRTLAEQTRIYRDSLRDHGSEFTSQFVALPGHSEHETGLAIDLALRQEAIDFISRMMAFVAIFGSWLRILAGSSAILRTKKP